MTERERLIKLIETARDEWLEKVVRYTTSKASADYIADYLIDKGVIVAPMPMADGLRQEITEYIYQRCVDEL